MFRTHVSTILDCSNSNFTVVKHQTLKPGNEELYKWLLGRAVSCRFHLQWWIGIKHTLILILAEVWWVGWVVKLLVLLLVGGGVVETAWGASTGLAYEWWCNCWKDYLAESTADSRCLQQDGTILCLRYHSCNYSLFFKHMHTNTLWFIK